MMKVARIATRLALFLNFSPHFAVAHASFLLSSFFSRVCIAPPKGRTSSVSSVIHPSHQSGDGDRLDQTRACLPSSFSTKHDVLTAFFYCSSKQTLQCLRNSLGEESKDCKRAGSARASDSALKEVEIPKFLRGTAKDPRTCSCSHHDHPHSVSSAGRCGIETKSEYPSPQAHQANGGTKC